MDTQHELPINSDTLAQNREINAQLLDETIRNLKSQKKVKNILFVGLPSAGKSSLINSLATLIHGTHLPVASVGQGVQQTHTYATPRYTHFGLTEDHLQVSINKKTARIIHPYLPNLDDFIGLSDQNTPEIQEVLSLKVFGYLQPGIQVTGLFKQQTEYGLGCLRNYYTQSMDEWKTDVIIFVHSVAVETVPKEMIACLLEVIKPKHTLRPVDLDLFVVLTNFDKVKNGEVSEETLKSIEDDVASSFGFHGFKGYKLFKITNWCDAVGFPNSSADNLCEWDEMSVSLNNQLLKLLRNISIPKAEQEPIPEITLRQRVWLETYRCVRMIPGNVQVFLAAHNNIYSILFGVFILCVVYFFLSR